jgi:2',3'-cyclic-nucleotide 2'-phosphodiesterase (5'-nucleotidase family)
VVRRRRDRDELPVRARPEHVLLAVALAACRGRAPAPAANADAAALVELPPPRGKVVSLVYSADVAGEYERCDCAVAPLGGFSRRAAEVDRIRAESSGVDGVIQVDAGDLFLPVDAMDASWRPAPGGEVERRARLLAAAYARLGVTAYTPGERDLRLGLPLLRRVLADAKIPVVSANLADERGHLLFDADRLVDVAGVRVGVFGVTAPSLVAPETLWSLRSAHEPLPLFRPPGVVVRDALAATRAEVASLRARGATIIVLLAHGGFVDELLARVPGIDWVVLGESPPKLETPEVVLAPAGHAVRKLGAMNLGRFLGRLDLHVVSGSGEGPWADRDGRATLAARIASHEQQIANLAGRAPRDARGDRLLETLRSRVADEVRELHALPPRITSDWFQNRVVALDTSVPDQIGTAALVAAYDAASAPARTKRVGLAASRDGASAASTRVGPGAGAKPSATYLGGEACARCHAPEIAFWRSTKHAGAFAALEQARSAQSLACVGCHVTGFAQPGGSMNVADLSTRLRDVGCEACHGPGSAHVDAPREPGLVERTPSAAACLGCHTPDRTPAPFDLAALTRAVVGPGHGAR